MVGRPSAGDCQDTAGRPQGRSLRPRHVTRVGQVVAHRVRSHLGDAVRTPRVRGRGGSVRVRRARDPRLDQDRARGERASRRRLPGGVLPDSLPRGNRKPLRGTAPQGRADADHLDCERDRPSDDSRSGLVRSPRPRGGHNGTHTRHEVQEAGRQDDPPGVRRDRRSADERVGRVARADAQARPRPRRGHTRPCRAGQEDIRHHALHGDPPRRHGRADTRQVEAPRVERRAVQDALPDAWERGAVEPLRRPSRRRAPRERHVLQGDRVLPGASGGDGRGCGGVVARPVQLRRDIRRTARDESQAHRRGGFLGRIPERPVAGRPGDGGAAYRGRHPRPAKRLLAAGGSDLGEPPHDVHRRPEDSALLRRVRVERRVHRRRRGLRRVARPETAVLLARRREPDPPVEAPEDGARGLHLRGPQGTDGEVPLDGVHS